MGEYLFGTSSLLRAIRILGMAIATKKMAISTKGSPKGHRNQMNWNQRLGGDAWISPDLIPCIKDKKTVTPKATVDRYSSRKNCLGDNFFGILHRK